MAHRVIKKLKPLKKKTKISYSRFLMAHRVIKHLKPLKKPKIYGVQSNKKKKILGKNIISYGALSNQQFEAFLKYLEKI